MSLKYGSAVYLLSIPPTVMFLVPSAVAAEAPLNYFLNSHGPAAAPSMTLGWVLTVICVLVSILVAGLLLFALIRRRPSSEPSEIATDEKAGVRWIIIGTAVSSVILLGMAVYSLIILEQISTPPKAPGLTVTVTGYNWWWKVMYDDEDPAKRIVTANEIHVPIGTPVLIKLKSADVIHGFWVPQLAGKTQMIPGLVNRQWVQADKPGRYRGACVQFCGLQHAHMGFEVVAQKPEDFEHWLAVQRKAAKRPTASQAIQGQKVFIAHCAACHRVRGTNATGGHGPDLTHLQSRRYIAAGVLKNTPQNLKAWITQAQSVKPGANMPNINLPEEDRGALMTYLATLK